jgi:group II intron reverse transcriptase/maturase
MERQDRTQHEDLWERIFSRSNLFAALERVRRNKGGPGIDGMTVEELPDHLRQHWAGIRVKLDSGRYVPSPVKRVEIPKPGGGERELGIPTVLDRMIQQAMHQTLSPIFEATFSPHSYGFRPGRSAHDAVKAARDYVEQGYNYVVDVDLAKFFDTVHHDRLMARLRAEIKDERVLKLLHAYLKAGVMVNGMTEATEEGTPQGGPLSPLLSNIALTELDRKLEERGHSFVRYADDCNIYVRSQRAADRVMANVTRFIEGRMRLQVNRDKSAADLVTNRTFLGFQFYRTQAGEIRIVVSQKSIKRAKSKLRKLTRRSQGNSLEVIRDRVNYFVIGWTNYYSLVDFRGQFNNLDRWLRRRMRQIRWKQWKTIRNRIENLLALGGSKQWAIRTSMSSKGCWHIAKSRPLHATLNNAYWRQFGLKSFLQQYNLRHT